MDFLAFLIQKLRQNKQKLIREIIGNYSAYAPGNWVFWPYLGHQKRQEVDLGLCRFIFQPGIQPNFEPRFWLIVRVMTS